MGSKTILVTGVYGFIGSNFAKIAVKEGFNVIGIGRDTVQEHKKRLDDVINYPQLTIIHKDIAKDDISEIMVEVDYIVNFAAKTFVDHSIRSPEPFIQSNIVGTYKLLEQARLCKPKMFIQISTDEVYGPILEGSHHENSPLRPGNPYSATKAAADILALSYYNTYGIPIIVTRTENNYGPGQAKEKAIPTFIRKCMDKEPIPLYGDGQHRRQWLHVYDHCAAIFALLEKGTAGEIYHIAGNKELTNLQLATYIRDYFKEVDPDVSKIQFIDDTEIRPGHDRRYSINSDKIHKHVGWQPEIDIDTGLWATIQHYTQEWGMSIEVYRNKEKTNGGT